MYNIYYYKNPVYASGKVIVKTVKSEKEADALCNMLNQNGGYEGDCGNKHIVDYEENVNNVNN